MIGHVIEMSAEDWKSLCRERFEIGIFRVLRSILEHRDILLVRLFQEIEVGFIELGASLIRNLVQHRLMFGVESRRNLPSFFLHERLKLVVSLGVIRRHHLPYLLCSRAAGFFLRELPDLYLQHAALSGVRDKLGVFLLEAAADLRFVRRIDGGSCDK